MSTATPAREAAARGDEAGERRRSPSLADAFAEFRRWPSPRIITAFLGSAIVVRALLGGYTLTDLWLLLGLLAAQPFVEWVVHTSVLHWRPREVLGRLIDPLVARKHREHHADPRDTELVFIPTRVLLTLIPIEIGIGLLVTPRVELAATYAVAVGIIGIVYEWVHYLVHTAYRPQTRAYRAIWRHHRLHHFKNENYWFSISNPAADRLLRTAPDPSEVPTSPTARDLLGTGS